MAMEELAINGGRPAKSSPFPEWPMCDEHEIQAVTNVLQSRQWWRGNGTQAQLFEQEFADYHTAQHALAVTNGTHAIELALTALGIGAGDEVIVPAFTFISTASAVLCINAVPVLVDVDSNTYCIDPSAVEAAITPRTRAIIPVHMAGQVADMDALIAIAKQHNLALLEDAAHAHGAEWKGQRVGALHSAGIFSFQAYKLMSAGEGGLILTNDSALMDRCFLYGNCGRPRNDRRYQHSVLGSNYRMSELHATVLRVQLTRLDAQIERREANARLLDAMLQDMPGITPQGRDFAATRHPHYMYMFRYDAAEFGGPDRQLFVDMLIAEGIPAFTAYLPIHQTPMFRTQTFGPRWRTDDPLLPDYSQVRCPVAENIGSNSVWLHHRVLLGSEEDVAEIVAAINKIHMHVEHVVSTG